MSCNLTTGFVNDCKNSAGGIYEVYVAPFSAKGGLTYASGSVTNSGSFLTTGSQFYRYALRKGTSEAKETINVNEANGTAYFSQEVDIVLTKTEILKRNEILLLAQNSMMVIVHDKTNYTGSFYLLGSDSGMELSGTQGTGKNLADLNGYTLKIAHSTGGGESYPMLFVPSSSMNALTSPA